MLSSSRESQQIGSGLGFFSLMPTTAFANQSGWLLSIAILSLNLAGMKYDTVVESDVCSYFAISTGVAHLASPYSLFLTSRALRFSPP